MANPYLNAAGKNSQVSSIHLQWKTYLNLLAILMLIDDNISTAIWLCMGYTVLLCFTLFKTSSLAKSIFNSH